MIINVSNKLKQKVIGKQEISKKESKLFIEYMINKTRIIVDNMHDKNYNYMYLFFEICYSYNINTEEISNPQNLYSIITVGNIKYLIDMNFNNPNIAELKKNKYIELTENKNIIRLYLDLKGETK